MTFALRMVNAATMVAAMALVLSVTALLASLFLLDASNGLLGTVLALRLGAADVGREWVGPVLACYSIGFILGAMLCARIIARVGHIRAFAAFAAIACCIALAHSLTANLYMWAWMRVVTGFSLAGMFMVVESWMNERAVNRIRGVMLSLYMIVHFSGAGAGQFLLNLAPIEGYHLFVIAAMIGALSLVPLALTTSEQPRVPTPERYGPRQLYKVSPLGVFGAFGTGIISGTFGSLAAVFAGDMGMDIEQISIFMGFALLSGLLLQFPIGLLSDRIDRRWIIVGTFAVPGVLAIAMSVLVLVAADQIPAWFIIVGACAFTAVVYTQYAVCVAHANDFAGPGRTTQVSAGLAMIWGCGLVLGPIVTSIVMAAIGPAGFWMFSALTAVVVVIVAVLRMRARPTVDSVTPYVPAYERATPAAVVLNPGVDPDDVDSLAQYEPPAEDEHPADEEATAVTPNLPATPEPPADAAFEDAEPQPR